MDTNLTIRQGETFSRIIRWSATPYIYTPITAITQAAPVVVTSTAHGLVSGWRAAVLSAGGMRQINAKYTPPADSEFHQVTVVDANTINFNDVDSSRFTAYTSGGFLVSYTPVSLAGFSARMQIRETLESATTIASLVSPMDIVLDDTNHTITTTITATATAAYDFESAVYDLELVASDGTVTRLLEGNIILSDEVTR